MSYTPICIEGFDGLGSIADLPFRGDWEHIISGTGLSYQSAGGRNGAGCVRHDTISSSTQRCLELVIQNRPDSVQSGLTSLKVGFAFRLNYSSAPSTGTTFRLIGLYDAAGTAHGGIFLAYTTGNWRIGYGATTAAFLISHTIGPSLPASGTWFHVEWECEEFRGSGGTDTQSLSVNGIASTTNSSQTSNIVGSSQTCRFVRINSMSSSSTSLASGESIDYDDFHCGAVGTITAPNTNFLGDMRVDHVVPILDGTDLDFTESAGADYYALLDEAGANDGDTTYIYGTAVDQRASVRMAALPHNPATIVCIHPYHIARREGAGSRSSRSYIKVAGTRYEGLAAWDLNHGTSYQGVWMNAYDTDLQVNPNTVVAYTKTDLTNIEIGVRISV